jgi:tetratricopeptide (TPR) repeat protein
VRHAYLHLVLDPIVASSRAMLEESSEMVDWLDGVADVSGEHVGDFEIMVVESLIRAVEMRLDEGSAGAPGRVDAEYRSGLLLIPFFVDQLDRFESLPTSMSRHFEDIVEDLDVGDERERFDTTFFSIDAPVMEQARAVVPPSPARPNPLRSRLADGQQAFNSGDNEAARRAFRDVLDQTGGANGPALYGMGLIASRDGDPETAMDYFLRTISSDDAEPGMKVWSQIFIGRIQDIGCEREAAVERYRAALEIGDDTNNARAAAQSGIGAPYGGGC